MREKLPRIEAKVSRDDKGMYIVNLTNLTRGCKDGQTAINATTCTIAECNAVGCTQVRGGTKNNCQCCGGSKCANKCS